MKCPNPQCNATDHEPGAKFCHKCGASLTTRTEDPSGRGGEKPKPNPNKTKGAETSKVAPPPPQRNPQRPSQRSNHRPVTSYGVSNLQRFRWGNVLRYLLLLAILVECIFVSIPEYKNYGPWGMVTIGMVNIITFICTWAACGTANMGEVDDESGFWGLYYRWLHFFLAAIIVLLGYLIVINIQEIWTLFLDMLLVGILTLANFETLQDIFD